MAQIWHERAYIRCYVFLYSTTCIYIPTCIQGYLILAFLPDMARKRAEKG